MTVPAPTLLIFGAGPNQLPVIEAGRRAGYRLLAVDQDPHAVGAERVDRFIQESVRAFDAICAAIEAETIHGVVARILDAQGLHVATRIAQNRGLPSACDALMEAATSKRSLGSHCRRAGLSTPPRLETAEQIGWSHEQVILRPDVSVRGKAGICRVDSADAFRREAERTSALSANGLLDASRWIDGIDISILVTLDRGHATRIALWDEWIALDEAGTIHGLGCAMPSCLEPDVDVIDALLQDVARSFPDSRTLVALSLRVDKNGRPWIIEIHLGPGGDGIPDQLLRPRASEPNVFDLFIATQTGTPWPRLDFDPAPRALVRDGASRWKRVEASHPDALRTRCRESIPANWIAPAALRPLTSAEGAIR